MARTFYAKYPGKCPECGEAIEQGAEVMYSTDNKVIHANCDSSPSLTPTAVICPRCNLQKPCDCDEEVRQMAAKVSFFDDQQNPPMARLATLEEEVESKVERDR